MNEIQAIAATLASLKTAGDMAKAFLDLQGAIKEQGKIFELNRIILSATQSALDAQATQSALLERIRSLEKQISDFETWEREKERYNMKDVNPARGSVFAYALKPDSAGTEPVHLLCAKCFQHRLKSMLQGSPKIEKGQRIHFCPECKTEYAIAATSAAPPGEKCPECGANEYRVAPSVPPPNPGLAMTGRTRHQMKCEACGFTDQRIPR